jgi:hypothetical protein
MDALRHATRIRTQRAVLKREVKGRVKDPASVILNPPEWAEGMKVEALLGSIRSLGEVRVHKLLCGCGVSHSKTIGGLTARQRRVLAEALGGRL